MHPGLLFDLSDEPYGIRNVLDGPSSFGAVPGETRFSQHLEDLPGHLIRGVRRRQTRPGRPDGQYVQSQMPGI